MAFWICADEVVEVRRPVHEVDLVGVDDEQRRLLVVVEVVVVGLDQLRDVLRRDPLLERPARLLDPLHAGLERPLEVDHEVRLGDRLGQKRVEPVVDQQLRVVEVQAGEDLVLRRSGSRRRRGSRRGRSGRSRAAAGSARAGRRAASGTPSPSSSCRSRAETGCPRPRGSSCRGTSGRAVSTSDVLPTPIGPSIAMSSATSPSEDGHATGLPCGDRHGGTVRKIDPARLGRSPSDDRAMPATRRGTASPTRSRWR